MKGRGKDACRSEVGRTRARASRTPEDPARDAGVVRLGAGVHQDRAYVAGHGPQNPDGSVAHPLGKVGGEVSPEEGYQAARLTALSILASLRRELGDLDRVTAWLMAYGFVNAAPDFTLTTNVINGFSDLIVELYGLEAGTHARTALGMATLPLGVPVIIAAEVAIST